MRFIIAPIVIPAVVQGYAVSRHHEARNEPVPLDIDLDHNFTAADTPPWLPPDHFGPDIAWTNPGPAPIDDDTWEKQICKGGQFLELMGLSDSEAGQRMNPPQRSAGSYWVDFPQQFADWGYHSSGTTNQDMSEQQYGLIDCLNSIGASTNAKEWEIWVTRHGNPSRGPPIDQQNYVAPDGIVRRMTGAEFQLGAHEQSGTLLMVKRYSPRHTASQVNPPVTDLPWLWRASDVMWGMWSVMAYEKIAGLKHVISWSVTNPTTQMTIRRVLQTAPPEQPGGDPSRNPLKYWPGDYFSAESEGCKALIGSPNGVGVAWMLIQRKAYMGKKRITGCRVFGSNSVLLFAPCVLFYIEDVRD